MAWLEPRKDITSDAILRHMVAFLIDNQRMPTERDLTAAFACSPRCMSDRIAGMRNDGVLVNVKGRYRIRDHQVFLKHLRRELGEHGDAESRAGSKAYDRLVSSFSR